jgi:membrane fusion protein, heavy metal efflux system
MNNLGTESTEYQAPTISGPNGPPHAQPHKRKRSILGNLVLLLLLGGVAGGAYYVYSVGTDRVQRDIDWVLNRGQAPAPEGTADVKPKEFKPYPQWDGLVKLNADEAKNSGLLVVTVEPQEKPIKLDLPGRTAYDPNSLNKIRPRFDTLVEKVHAELGQKVKKGDPLVDLFSTDLAAAKNDFQTAYVQWQHDLTLRMVREKLFKQGEAISAQLLTDTRNDENKSRLAVTTARQKLIVFEVPEPQIDELVKNLNPTELPDKDAMHTVLDKAKMTRRSPVDGIVVLRDVVPGNLYDNNDVLLVIAPLDHLIVWLNVYEADSAKVAVGQHLEIHFPFLNRTILGTVQYVAAEVSKETHAIRVRASIPNVAGDLRAEMLVKASLEIPPVDGQTVIPRSAVVVMNGHEYAFVRKPPTGPEQQERFERRELEIAEERSDHVVIASGTKAGEEVASRGSLILAQCYEDQQTVATGMPVQ